MAYQLSRRPTRRDVAQLAGVSVATVSYVVNKGPQKLSPETRKRVHEAVDKLGYRPDPIARSLKTGYSKTIGLIVPTIASPGMAMMANIVQETLMGQDYFVITANTREQQKLENNMLELMLSQSVDGLILCPVGNMLSEQITLIINEKFPIVFMDRFIPDYSANLVVTDSIKATKQAAHYLVDLGCKTMLCISFSDKASSAIDRYKGCCQGFLEAGIPDENVINLIVDDPTGILAEVAFLSYIDRYGLPEGIVCTTQEIGISVFKALSHRNISFPLQKVVIFDADWAEMMNPRIPTISQNFLEIGRTTAKLLLEQLGDSTTPPQSVYVEARFSF